MTVAMIEMTDETIGAMTDGIIVMMTDGTIGTMIIRIDAAAIITGPGDNKSLYF